MTDNDIKALQEIQGSGGFRVMEFLIKEKMKKLESVMGVDKNGLVAEQTLGRQLAYEVLSEFLKEINLSPKSEKQSNTYE